mmetsp:Transcript_31025/g.94945  ORF Transcript_31025/g.94945 Transcript_31025/m.94945 type:complete len:270 (+) Transcript_31025:216-1025(+)
MHRVRAVALGVKRPRFHVSQSPILGERPPSLPGCGTRWLCPSSWRRSAPARKSLWSLSLPTPTCAGASAADVWQRSAARRRYSRDSLGPKRSRHGEAAGSGPARRRRQHGAVLRERLGMVALECKGYVVEHQLTKVGSTLDRDEAAEHPTRDERPPRECTHGKAGEKGGRADERGAERGQEGCDGGEQFGWRLSRQMRRDQPRQREATVWVPAFDILAKLLGEVEGRPVQERRANVNPCVPLGHGGAHALGNAASRACLGCLDPHHLSQ